MAIQPILLNTEMVRAVLDGRKTVTRRKITYECPTRPESTLDTFIGTADPQQLVDCCQYQVGDVLWVRETWCNIPVSPGGHTRINDVCGYKADGDLRPDGWQHKWRPSIHMPRAAARTFLRVTGVRVEKLQDIDEGAARAEGFSNDVMSCDGSSACKKFSVLWDSTIKKADLPRYRWDANPWVWVIEFERCERPRGFV